MNDTNLEMPLDHAPDETDISIRAYFSRMSDERLRQYRSDWTDEQTIEWDGNSGRWRLMLVCCERDIDIEEYRQVIEEHIRRRGL